MHFWRSSRWRWGRAPCQQSISLPLEQGICSTPTLHNNSGSRPRSKPPGGTMICRYRRFMQVLLRKLLETSAGQAHTVRPLDICGPTRLLNLRPGQHADSWKPWNQLAAYEYYSSLKQLSKESCSAQGTCGYGFWWKQTSQLWKLVGISTTNCTVLFIWTI
jgi:hypothetical protein